MLGGMASAQEILNESFTSDNLPEGWTSIVGEDGSYEWTGYSYGYGPDYETGHAELYPGYEGVNNAWLITPMLEPSAENHILTFWISNVGYGCDFDATRMKLRVSTASLDTNDFTNTLATYLNTEIQADFPCTYNGEDWAKKSVDLTDFIGQKIYIAFQVLDNSLVDVGLDEVSGIPLFAYDNDASIESIDVIAEDFVQIGTDVRLRAIVKNKGKNKNPVTVSFSVDGIPVGSQRIDFASNPDTAYLDYSFENTGTYTVKASLPDDDDANNNTHETKVDVYPANFLFEDFHADSPFPPENWQFAVTNGNVDFSNEDYEGTGGALSTPGYLQIPYDYITASEDNPSISYSITPQLRPSPEYHTLSFYVQLAGSPYGEGTTSFEVLLSETTASTEDFAIQLAQYEATENEADLDAYEWAYREIDLTDYIGKDVYVAFRVEDPGLSSWYVDEVKGLPLSIFEKDARVRMLALEDPYRYYFSGDEIRLKAIVDNPGLENLDGLHVELQVNGQAHSGTTGTDGTVQLPTVLKGNYTLRVSKAMFDEHTEQIEIGEDKTALSCELKESLTAPVAVRAMNQDNQVQVNWYSAYGTGSYPHYVTWSTGQVYSGIGQESGLNFSAAHRYEPYDIEDFRIKGTYVTKIRFFACGTYGEVPTIASFSVAIWDGSEGTLVYEQAVPDEEIVWDGWTEITLNTPYFIDGSKTVYIGYICNCTSGWPAGVDLGPVVRGKGNLINIDGGWMQLTGLATSMEYNWLIEAYCTDAEEAEMEKAEAKAEDFVQSYGVYRLKQADLYKPENWTELAPGTTQTSLTDNISGLDDSYYLYAVRAIYATGQSDYTFSNIIGKGLGNESSEAVASTMTAHPNPNHGQFSLDVPFEGDFRIFDRDGRIVMNRHLTEGRHWMDITLPAGNYLMLLVSDKATSTGKLIIL